MMNDTIAAIATPVSPSAIGILRLSGPGSVPILDQVFSPFSGAPMSLRDNRQLVYGVFHDLSGRVLDQCLATVSRAPHSYTGEDTVELQCHGSSAALILGLEVLFCAGARQAGPGEFTRRAFLNGKLDLAQAEAVADLIEAGNPNAVYQAAGQLGGALSRVIDEIYDGLTDLTAHFYAVLDYPDEDIDPFESAEITSALEQAGKQLDQLISSYRRGRAILEGLPCAIVGRPNAGKSTLFNALVGYERAIVTPIPGTTRDTVEHQITLGDTFLRLIDTAGIRNPEDEVEKLGVERSRAAMEQAELTLVLADRSRPFTGEDQELLQSAAAGGAAVLVYTKTDLPPADCPPLSCPSGIPSVQVSALTGQGLEELERAVSSLFPKDPGLRTGSLLTNARQVEATGRAREAVQRAASAQNSGLSPDAVLTDVEEAMSALGELTGKTVREDITDRIFSRFCVGK